MAESRGSIIVGIGASAGGLDACKQLLPATKADAGLAYVLVQHLDPTHDSMMAELLEKYAPLPVAEIADREQVKPNHVYVIPPDRYVRLQGDRLVLTPPTEDRGSRMAIDVFFRSLAEARKRRAVGVVLSGTGSDGTVGLRAIKAAGGLAIAQDPETAGHHGMPRSVIEQGIADLVLPPKEIPPAILNFLEHPYASEAEAEAKAAADAAHKPTDATAAAEERSSEFEQIVELLREQADLDLTHYKESTLLRRIQRRMGLNQVQHMGDYVRLLRERRSEVEQLVRDLHISVTDFFRDPEAYESIEREVLPALFKRAAEQDDDEGRSIRLWTPGCATGEEAFSLAILLLETKHRHEAYKDVRIQVFATDVDEEAIRVGRAGTYPASSLASLSRERRERYFSRAEDQGRFRIKQFVRDTISFARHDLLSDPPFSKLDLISCRNLLIYLRREAQQSALELFHFSLRPGGYLFLGPSESVGEASELFRTIDNKWRIYRRLDAVDSRRPALPAARRLQATQEHHSRERPQRPKPTAVTAAAQAVLAVACTPPSVVVNQNFKVLYLHGDLVEYLDLPQGAAEMALMDMLRDEIRTRVRAAMFRAAREKEPVRARGRMTTRAGTPHDLTVIVRPATSDSLGDELLVVSFESEPVEAAQRPAEVGAGEKGVSSELERELHATRADLNATVTELENANEELRSANEEAMTMNEELQSSNEELETQSEELRSVNEELTTVNSQLREKMEELQETNSDIANLLTSTKLPAVFLDESFCIRRYTPEARKLLHVIETDIGRPLHHIRGACVDDGLLHDAKAVLDGLTPVEKELQVERGAWYVRRVLPYRTEDNRIAGVVVTFSEITRQKEMTTSLERREQQQAAVTNLGQRALRGLKRQALFDNAVQTLTRTLDCRFAKVLQLLPDRSALRVVAGTGWRGGVVAETTVSAGPDSQAGFTIEQAAPVIVSELSSEARFSGPALLKDHGVHSGLSVVIPGPNGEPYGVLGVHHDEPRDFSQHDVEFVQAVANVLGGAIQREAVEQQVRENEEKFRTLADNISQFAWMADEKGWIFWYNRRWFEYTGTTLEEMEGWGWRKVHHPEHVDQVTEKFRRHIEAGEPWEDTFPLRSKDGEFRWFLSRAIPIRDEDGNVVRWFGTNTDITEQLEADRRVRSEQQRLQAILDNAPATIYAKDRAGRFILCNRQTARLIGQRPEDVLGRTDAELPGFAARAPEYQAHDQRVWETGEPLTVEETLATDDGERTFMSVKFPLRDHQDHVYAVCGITSDITERKENEEHLRMVMAELNHRVKNTLATIDAIAVQTSTAATDVRAFTESFRSRIRSMAAAHGLLTRREWKGVELREILRSELASRVRDDGDGLTLDGPELAMKPKHALALHMAVHELATNAAKYGSLSAPAGKLHVAWQIVESPEGQEVVIDWHEQDGPPVMVPQEFSFGTQMIDDVIGHELAGTVERAWKTEGLRCRIRFPQIGSERRDAVRVRPSAAESGHTGQVRILLVEDATSLARLMRIQLEQLGCHVVGPAATLDQGLNLVDAESIDGAILDVDLDGTRVYPLAHELAERNVPYILVTGFGSDDLPGDLSPDQIVAKPVDMDAVKQWLAGLS